MSDVAGRPLTYDADSHVRSFTSGSITYTYSYDGDGRRVRRDFNDGSLHTTVYVYDATGLMLAEYTSDPIVTVPPADAISYLTSDQLGSPRVVTRSDGSVKARHDYLPFGEDVASNISGRSTVTGYASQDSLRQKFTSKERDAESSLDYFLARYYSSAQGRFTSTDEFTGGPDELFDFTDDASDNPTFYADLTEPQTLNKYHYCLNNPLLYVDIDGHQGIRQWIKDTLRGAASAFNEDNGMPGPSGNQTTTGRAIGHGMAILQGVSEVVIGGGMATGGTVGGAATAPTVVGPVAGAAVTAGGVVVAAHGGAVLTNTGVNILTKNGPSEANSSSQQSSPSRSKERIRYNDPASKLSLRDESLTTGSKKLRELGLKERITKTGRHEFYDPKTGRSRAAYDAANSKGESHWHKFAPDGRTSLNNRGKVVNKDRTAAHIPAQ